MSSANVTGFGRRAGNAVSRPSAVRPTGTASGFLRTASRIGRVLSSVLAVTAAVVFLLIAVGPRFLGYQTSTMLTGSMSPLINPGDVVVTVPIAVKQLAVGDIITYQIPIDDHRVETHRITEITTNANGSTAIRTKGDANPSVDPWVATLSQDTAYRQIFTVPYLGNVIRTLREPAVNRALMYGAPALLVVGVLVGIWCKKPDADAVA